MEQRLLVLQQSFMGEVSQMRASFRSILPDQWDERSLVEPELNRATVCEMSNLDEIDNDEFDDFDEDDFDDDFDDDFEEELEEEELDDEFDDADVDDDMADDEFGGDEDIEEEE